MSIADIDREFSDARSLVVTWLNRGTLHLVAAQDYWWLHPLTTPPALRANRRLLLQLGLAATEVEHGVALIADHLGSVGQARPTELRERLRAAGITVAGPIGYLLLAQAGLLGLTVRGPILDGEQAYVLTDRWLTRPPGRPDPPSRVEALARLARRYLDGHGPAGPADLARWAGIGLRAARTGLQALDDTVPAVGSGGVLGPDSVELSSRRARSAEAGRAQARLLGPFDPVMFGWVDRRPLLGEYESALVTRNALFRPAILAGDRLVGEWRYVPAPEIGTAGRVIGASGRAIELAPFEPLTDAESAVLQRDARAVVRFVGGA